ncbi:MAG: hypothetical protein U0T36_07475 [Saprospiraceae bacterium]
MNIRGNADSRTINNDNVGDTPMPNVTIQLKDAVTGAVVVTTTTNASGNYDFERSTGKNSYHHGSTAKWLHQRK